jgi:predicted transcriptional regulator
MLSGMAACGHRVAARSVLDNIEHGGRLITGRGVIYSNNSIITVQ